ncbi:DUF2125 domain-containing protein [Ruegeria marina]|uniref:DUF2125 domain-containing protein n=1 Tax=Ruegeria marina TaxID=639004 RepID=A0A1G6NZQ7_9RHOB|nr:DUF2125 domain-containing protein [Ruegeria marina]SDC72665.1 hypothetical protein SAMN04488239_103251 [Ruegeria marina]
MSVFLRRTSGAIIAYAIASQCAWADLTADQVWADWKAYLGGMGYEITGNESRSGDTLTISGMSMAMQIPEAEGALSVTLPEMSLTDQGDGTVRIGLPEEFPIGFMVTPEGEGTVKGTVNYLNRNMSMVVSGAPEDMTYTYSADQVTVSLAALEADGEPMPEGALAAVLDMTGVAGTSQMKISAMREMVQGFTADGLSYALSFDDPESEDAGTFNGSLSGISYAGSGTIPTDFDADNFSNMLESGFAFDGTLSYTAGNGTLNGTGDGETVAFSSKSQGGKFRIAMDASHVVYDLSSEGAEISLVTQELPFPVDLAMARSGFKLDIPVQAGDAPQPFAFGMNLTDFTMSDMIWGMFDPAGGLPRDPATIALDVSGTARVFVDFLDPTVAETLEATGAAPGELNTLKINQLLVSLVGAKLSGTGEFEFDNGDLESFDGMPAPSGVANLTLVGANALIDKLTAMGFISEDDAMGARMMMGMLAVPGDAPDTLNSTIEINEQGHIMANGQRIK